MNLPLLSSFHTFGRQSVHILIAALASVAGVKKPEGERERERERGGGGEEETDRQRGAGGGEARR